MNRFILLVAFFVSSFSNSLASEGACKRVLLIGDSQMAFGVWPFRFDHTFDETKFDRRSPDGFGTILFKYFARNGCADSVFHYSQGGSGATDWLGEAEADGTSEPQVRFLGGSRMILQPGFATMIVNSGELDAQGRKYLAIPPLAKLVDDSNWMRPDLVVVALSANDWWLSEADFIGKYRKLMRVARGTNGKRECLLAGVAGVVGAHSKYLRAKGEPESVTDENVKKLVRAGKQVAREVGCVFSDLSGIEPSAGDGLHLFAKSARAAAMKVIQDYEVAGRTLAR
jgi:hypothetical protein